MHLDTNISAEEFPILIVEDNPDLTLLLKRTLDGTGFPVSSAANGREALACFENAFFPIVITDWMMPELNGLELCQRLRESDLPGYVFILVLTAKDSISDIVQGLESGADDYLVKPFKKAELRARLKSAMRILNLEKTLRMANEEIRLLSITDPLTGCFNRGHMVETFKHELRRIRRSGQPLSIIMCDIDRFKSINDEHGHQTGDFVLKSFVETLSHSVRDGLDSIFRYGGEEFLVMLTDTGPEDALVMAERIRKTIEKQTVEFEGKTLKLTASFGVTGLPASQKNGEYSMEAIVNQADQFLYDCKRNGRNQVLGAPFLP